MSGEPPRGAPWRSVTPRRAAWRRLAAAAIIVTLATLSYVLFWPVDIVPYAWTPGPTPDDSGPYTPNQDLTRAELLSVTTDGGAGPETVAQDPHDGLLYTGLLDGWIIRLDPRTGRRSRVANTGGRPLGMAFDATDTLHVADGWKGILRVSRDGALTAVTDCGDGKVPGYTDSLTIASDGAIWFTCPSRRWSLAEINTDAMETQPTGRLMRYDPAHGSTTTVLDQLLFANGVTMGPDERFVLVDEWYGYRIRRLWLQGPKRGQSDVFVDNLPGYPDNIARAPDGLFWVGLVVRRIPLVDRLHPHPFLMKILARIPESRRPKPAPFAWLVALDGDGRVVHNLQDSIGRLTQVTGALEIDGTLIVTSNASDAMGRLPVPPRFP